MRGLDLRQANKAVRLALMAARHRLGLTQAEAAALVRRDHSQVSRYESVAADPDPLLTYIFGLAAAGGPEPVQAIATAIGAQLVLEEPDIPQGLQGTSWEGAYREATRLFAHMFQTYTQALDDHRIDRQEHLRCASDCDELIRALAAMATFHRAAAERGAPTRPEDVVGEPPHPIR
jgi:transcriptional regulator with XRE-family HTH domain